MYRLVGEDMAYTQAGKRANYKYRATKTKRIDLNFKIEDYNRIKTHASNADVPTATYIREAVSMRMDSDDTHTHGGKRTHANKGKD